MFNCLNWSLKICLAVHHFVRQWIRLWDKSVEKLEMWKGPDGNPWYEERTGQLINPKLINLAAVTLATGWIVHYLYYWHACFWIFKSKTNSEPELFSAWSCHRFLLLQDLLMSRERQKQRGLWLTLTNTSTLSISNSNSPRYMRQTKSMSKLMSSHMKQVGSWLPCAGHLKYLVS